jgi:hypothetical protein
MFSFYVNKTQWERLPGPYQAAFDVAAVEANMSMIASYDARNPQAIRRLIQKGVELRRYPDAILKAAYRRAQKIYAAESAVNEDFKKIYASMRAFQKDSNSGWDLRNRPCRTLCKPAPMPNHRHPKEKGIKCSGIYQAFDSLTPVSVPDDSGTGDATEVPNRRGFFGRLVFIFFRHVIIFFNNDAAADHNRVNSFRAIRRVAGMGVGMKTAGIGKRGSQLGRFARFKAGVVCDSEHPVSAGAVTADICLSQATGRGCIRNLFLKYWRISGEPSAKPIKHLKRVFLNCVVVFIMKHEMLQFIFHV